MAPNFQSSFIPKEPVTEEVFRKKKAGVLGVLVVSLFIFSIVVSVGIYFYKGIIRNEIKDLESELAAAETNIDKKAIEQLSQFDRKLTIAKSIVVKHQVISRFLETLSSSTVSSVQFESFNYGNLEEGKLVVNVKGKAASYTSVALQEKILSENKYFKSIAFSNLTLADKGLVSFELAVSVDPQISNYLAQQYE